MIYIKTNYSFSDMIQKLGASYLAPPLDRRLVLFKNSFSSLHGKTLNHGHVFEHWMCITKVGEGGVPGLKYIHVKIPNYTVDSLYKTLHFAYLVSTCYRQVINIGIIIIIIIMRYRIISLEFWISWQWWTSLSKLLKHPFNKWNFNRLYSLSMPSISKRTGFH